MIISSCPLRISLFGGSTDNPYFVEKYGRGSVISFTSSLKTYVTISQDKIGFNKDKHKYIINYSKREEVSSIKDIKNEFLNSLTPTIAILTSSKSGKPLIFEWIEIFLPNTCFGKTIVELTIDSSTGNRVSSSIGCFFWVLIFIFVN